MFSREYCEIFKNPYFEEDLRTAASADNHSNIYLNYFAKAKLSSLEILCSVGKGVLGKFSKFTGKHQCQCLFFNKVAVLRPATLLKKETLALVFSCEF